MQQHPGCRPAGCRFLPQCQSCAAAPVQRGLIDAAHLVEHKQRGQQHGQREDLGAVLARLQGGGVGKEHASSEGRQLGDGNMEHSPCMAADRHAGTRQTPATRKCALWVAPCFQQQQEPGNKEPAAAPPASAVPESHRSGTTSSGSTRHPPGRKHRCPLCPAAPASTWSRQRRGAPRGRTTSTGLRRRQGEVVGARMRCAIQQPCQQKMHHVLLQ